MFLTDLTTDQLMLLVIPALPNMWALKHAMYHDFPTSREKYRWMMACVFLPCVGGVAYFFVGRKHASKEKIDIFAKKGEDEAPPVTPGDGVSVPSDAEETAAVSSETKEDSAAASPKSAPVQGKDEWSFGCPDDVRKGSS